MDKQRERRAKVSEPPWPTAVATQRNVYRIVTMLTQIIHNPRHRHTNQCLTQFHTHTGLLQIVWQVHRLNWRHPMPQRPSRVARKERCKRSWFQREHTWKQVDWEGRPLEIPRAQLATLQCLNTHQLQANITLHLPPISPSLSIHQQRQRPLPDSSHQISETIPTVKQAASQYSIGKYIRENLWLEHSNNFF